MKQLVFVRNRLSTFIYQTSMRGKGPYSSWCLDGFRNQRDILRDKSKSTRVIYRTFFITFRTAKKLTLLQLQLYPSSVSYTFISNAAHNSISAEMRKCNSLIQFKFVSCLPLRLPATLFLEYKELTPTCTQSWLLYANSGWHAF